MSTTTTRRSAPSRRTSIVALLGLFLSFLVGSVLTASPAAASHYRANQVTWHKVSGNQVEFHLTGSWRCTFFFSSGSGCSASPGDTFFAGSFAYGDGNGASPQFTVTSVDTTNDVLSAEAHLDHTYPGPGPWTASLDDCCRLSPPSHINNPDFSLRVESLVDLTTGTASPESQIAPIVDCPVSGNCAFQVPAVDQDGRTLRWRFSNPPEDGGITQPGPPYAPNAATINATTGLYSWNTTGAQLAPSGSTFYSTQVTIDALNNAGQVVSKVAVDFFIRLGSNSQNQQPVFNPPTPADGTVINATVGSPVTFNVNASDPDGGDTVTLGMLGKPASATYTTNPGNPATGAFSWTPTATGDTLLTLTAQDQQGLGATPRSITIHVTNGANRPPVVVARTLVPYRGKVNQPITIRGRATDPDGDPLTTTWRVATSPPTAVPPRCTIADPHALVTTVTCSVAGNYTVTLTASDGFNPPVSDSASLTVLP